ncbi:hypothetical protein DL89DRAFT_282725 [Linderina pennispora]|uniref:Phosphatidylinositol-glycan-specific phospholipase D n=1 Tax=Linderina pennispora TaxID=61395 RepID=A0A1Y1WCL4_9FUNG|nr:uncharacterized protein DL89DRAFT_282725 [Linderina pennispora]ORX71279.1 hypothetical protein DL89DRAFT_282725 [Linderina pennispora]
MANWRTIQQLAVGALLLGCGAQGCGPAVHNEVAERARQWFHEPQGSGSSERIAYYRGILDRHPEALQAGVVFPDWGYGCLSNDDPAEAAHWTPFLETGLEYFLQTYRQPLSDKAEQLAAFLFGIASHQVADELWHSLSGLTEGLMQVLANSTFNGEFSRAHDTLDVGGDFALAHMNDLAFMLDKWTVPVDDVLAIYRMMDIDVARWRLNMCVTRQFYTMEAVKRFGLGLFPSYAARAPILTERIEDYFVGGLFSMATATSDCWYSLVEWFDRGDFSKKCLISDQHDRHHRHRRPGKRLSDYHGSLGGTPMQRFVEAQLAEHQEQMRAVANVTEHDGTLYLGVDPRRVSRPSHRGHSRQHVFGRKVSAHAGSGDECAELTTLYPKVKQLYTMQAYSGFGQAVAMGDFSGNGNTDVAISAPYYKPKDTTHGIGAVFVQRTRQPLRYSLFGSALTVVDLNADGIDDLVVGSSGYGETATGDRLGRIDVYLGRRGAGLPGTPDLTLTADQLALYTDSPWSRQRIGTHLFSADINNDGFNDLVIGAPYHSEFPFELHSGRVFGYLARQRQSSEGHLGPPDFVVVSPERLPFEWFGQSASAVHVQNTTLLLVYGFKVGKAAEYDGLEFTLWTDRAQLGSSIHVWDAATDNETVSIVLFGSPSERNPAMAMRVREPPASQPPERGWQAGGVRVIDPQRWMQVGASAEDGRLAGLLSTLRGSQSPGHFGRALASTPSEVWIGEPFSGIEEGRVYRWRPDFDRPQCFAMRNANGQARLGSVIEVAQRSGRESLVVGAPHDSQFARLTGSVLLMQK